jgi:hypothetical protein
MNYDKVIVIDGVGVIFVMLVMSYGSVKISSGNWVAGKSKVK